MKRLLVALALLALAALIAYVLRWGLPWDDESIGKLPNVEPDDVGEFELWHLPSGNRVGHSPGRLEVETERDRLVRLGEDPDDLIIVRGEGDA